MRLSRMLFALLAASASVAIVESVPAGAAVAAETDVGTVDPARLLDTRENGSTVDGLFEGSGKVGAGSVTRVQITGRGEVPIDAVGVELNVTAIQSEGGGFTTLYPCNAVPPTASTLNFSAGVNIANATTVALNDAGEVCVFTSATSHYALDVVAFIPAGSGVGTVDPARLLDTRENGSTVDGLFEGSGKVGAGSVTRVQITGRGEVPIDAVGVELNVTAIQSEGGGFTTLYPCNAVPPTASTLNFSAGVNIANATTVALNDAGEVCVFTSATSHYALDVVAFIPAGSGVGTVDPARLLDTRENGSTVDGLFEGSGKVGAGSVTRVQITGRGEVPIDAVGVELNVTAIQSEGGGFTTLYPCNAVPPTASTLNFSAGVNIANATTVALNDAGEVCVFTSATSHYALDVVAFIAPTEDPGGNSIVRVGSGPNDVLFDGTDLWVPNTGSRTVSRIDRVTNMVTETVDVSGGTLNAAFDGTDIWVTGSNGLVSRIDRVTNQVTSTIDLGVDAFAVTSDGTSVWATSRFDFGPSGIFNTVSKINPVTNTVLATVEVQSSPHGIEFADTDIWVSNLDSGSVSRIDPTTNAVIATVFVGPGTGPAGMTFDGTYLWVANLFADSVSKIDVSTNTVVASLGVGDAPVDVTFDGSDVWITNSFDDTVTRIDSSAEVVIETITVGGGPNGISFDGTDIWMANELSNFVSRISPA